MKYFMLLVVVFWNLENFFDYFDGGCNESDKSFSSYGDRHWTKKRFYAKCSAISKTVFLMAGSEDMPELLCFAEVENSFVLRKLVESTLLKKYGYRIIHYESEDPRGIDVGLLYRKLKCCSSRPVRIYGLKTRDILLAQFLTPEGDSLAVFVNHHPSKYSGASSEGKRLLAMKRLKQVSDSLAAAGWTKQLALGDFNDIPGPCPLDDSFNNLAADGKFKGAGTIKYNGIWQLIDQAFVSKGLKAEMRIADLPFLTVPDSSFPGTKPLRTYSGPRYLGGVSDHYPIVVGVLP